PAAPSAAAHPARLTTQTTQDRARLGAEIARLATVAAAVHSAQLAEDQRQHPSQAQNVRDQAFRLRLAVQGASA
ncbi:MAG: hypothetical protein ACK54T_02925, partial [bacterium]